MSRCYNLDANEYVQLHCILPGVWLEWLAWGHRPLCLAAWENPEPGLATDDTYHDSVEHFRALNCEVADCNDLDVLARALSSGLFAM
jgi:hypothetical protein